MSNFNEEMAPIEKTYWDTFCWLKAGWMSMALVESVFGRQFLIQYLSNPEVQSKVKLLGMCYRELEAEGKWQG